MFSPYVITAIEVLLRLDSEGAEQRGTDFTELLRLSAMRRPIVRKVLSRLSAGRYIELVSAPNRYILRADIGEISLLQVIRLFHGDICLGEAYDHYLTLGRENYDSEHYKVFIAYEHNVYETLAAELSVKALTDFKSSLSIKDPLRSDIF